MSEATVKFIKPGPELHGLIPYSVYKLGGASSSPFIAIERDGDPYSVLIPTMELLRFYYSGSSKLNQAIFSSKLTDLNNVLNLNRCSFDEDTQSLTVCLRQDYPDDDAAMLGHWYLNEFAHRQVLNVWNGLIKFTQWQNFTYFPLEIGFPFTGTTQLQGQGIELPTPDGIARKRKLMLTLIRCSHPRPFRKLIHTRDNEAGPGANDTPGQGQRPTAGYRQRIIIHANPSKTPELESEGVNDPFSNPSLDIQPELIRVGAHRFPAIEFENRVKEQSTHKSGPAGLESDETVPNQSTSEPAAGDTGTAAISIVPTEHTDPPDEKKIREIESLPITFETFNKVVEELNKLAMVEKTTEILIDPVVTKAGQHMSQFPSEFTDRRVIRWSTVIEDKDTRPRLAMVLKIETDCGVHYLLEVERKQNTKPDGKTAFDREFATYLFSDKGTCQTIKDEKIKTLLRSLAEASFKKHKNVFNNLGFFVDSKKHQSSASERAEQIKTSMTARWSAVSFGRDDSTAVT